ncbi:MAG: hypothetical protein LBC96_01080 [Lachnospiraceae bacterium]|nr:hypothetical protein [Lachnospiraceae bacterium]
MENKNDIEKNIDSINVMQNKQKSRLPIIAFAFSISPIFASIFGLVFWGLGSIEPLIGIIFLYFSVFGLPITGIVLAVIALCNRKKHVGVIGLILSIVAIIFPFLWLGIMFLG